ncbi:MAG: DinB family protein [Daejeonella sp.]
MIAESLKYTKLADEIMIDVFESNTLELEKAEQLFSHVLSAQHVWMKRILGEKEELGIWQLHDRKLFREIHNSNFLMIDKILDQIELENEIKYRNSSGQEFSNKVKDILFHVVNHSTYHRGQIATLLKAAGISPPVTDYIMLKRQDLI